MSVTKIVVLFLLIASCSCDTVKRAEVLDYNGKYSVEWEVDLETEIIVFTLDVETTGFVGFGISMNPSMEGADIVIGGVRDNQTTYFNVIYMKVDETFQCKISNFLTYNRTIMQHLIHGRKLMNPRIGI